MLLKRTERPSWAGPFWRSKVLYAGSGFGNLIEGSRTEFFSSLDVLVTLWFFIFLFLFLLFYFSFFLLFLVFHKFTNFKNVQNLQKIIRISKFVHFFKKNRISKILFMLFKKCSCFSKMFGISKIVHVFLKCLALQKFFKISKNRSRFQILFKKCSKFREKFRIKKNCFFENLFEISKNGQNFKKQIAFSKDVAVFIKCSLFFQKLSANFWTRELKVHMSYSKHEVQ